MTTLVQDRRDFLKGAASVAKEAGFTVVRDRLSKPAIVEADDADA